MSYRIIVDSCCDKTAPMAEWSNITFVPLTLEIGDYSIPDDESFDQDDFIKRTVEYDGVAKTACPSPAAWAEAFDCEEDELYVMTISAKLSGTYNSAVQGVELYNEEHPGNNKKIHVFDSCATSGLESITAEYMQRILSEGISFEDAVPMIEDYLSNSCKLFFVLETLDVLKKNGRLGALAAGILKKLKVKMVFERTVDGFISLTGQDFSINKAYIKMANIIAKDVEGRDLSGCKLVISHVCCEDRAKFIAEKICELVDFGQVEIVKCSGLNSVYAANGGILVSYSNK